MYYKHHWNEVSGRLVNLCTIGVVMSPHCQSLLIEESDSSGKEGVVLLRLCSAGVTLSRGAQHNQSFIEGEGGGYPAWMSSKVVQGRAECLWSPSVLCPFLKRVSLFSN